jgi:hypothetical protein
MTLREEIAETFPETLLLEPATFDAAIIGVTERFGQEVTVCYDLEKLLGILVEDGMTYEEAVEYYEYNIVGAYLGERTPTFLNPMR